MKGMILKKAFLIGGILLLATFMSVPFSWSCDDDDKWDRDCHDKRDCDHHDKWDCHKHGKPCHPPRIQIVYLSYPADSIEFRIWGKNFDNGAPPVVTLGGTIPLNVIEHYDDYIKATLSLQDLQEEFIYGDYRLVVSTCGDSACKDKYCKDHGPNCKCKYCKDHCSKCKDKYCKDKYCKNYEYKCKCKDRYSLTIAGPSGPSGLPGISGYEKNVIRAQITFPLEGGNTVEVPCSTANKKLLGGGGGITSFVAPSGSSPDHFYVIYNGPGPESRPDGREAWVIKWKYPYEYGTTVDIVIYAICADALD